MEAPKGLTTAASSSSSSDAAVHEKKAKKPNRFTELFTRKKSHDTDSVGSGNKPKKSFFDRFSHNAKPKSKPNEVEESVLKPEVVAAAVSSSSSADASPAVEESGKEVVIDDLLLAKPTDDEEIINEKEIVNESEELPTEVAAQQDDANALPGEPTEAESTAITPKIPLPDLEPIEF